MIKMIKELQNISNRLYEKYGLTDEVLDLQILINKYCNGYDVLSDEDLILNGEYVQ